MTDISAQQNDFVASAFYGHEMKKDDPYSLDVLPARSRLRGFKN
jgi:hypothetical protein